MTRSERISSAVVERPAKVPTLKHFWEGYLPEGPQAGQAALCGFVPPPTETFHESKRDVGPDRCVVCLEIAIAKGYRI